MRRLTLVMVAGLLFSPDGVAQAPKSGDVQRLTVISVAVQASGTKDEAKRVTYTPPPGWHVRSHEVKCTLRRGRTSYAVGTVPADWSSSTEEHMSESSKKAADLAAESPGVGGQAKVRCEGSRERAQGRSDGASHHALVVEASAKGAGLFQSEGTLELTVVAELVYTGR
jgi:hypothetical protein